LSDGRAAILGRRVTEDVQRLDREIPVLPSDVAAQFDDAP
jgi:hypothetical protein